MNTPNEPQEHERADDYPPAVRHARTGAAAWRAAARAQLTATPDHADFYGIAAELVDSLAAIEALAGVLASQVETYAHRQPRGQRVYDDSRDGPAEVDPATRLADATEHLRGLHEVVIPAATRSANAFWSAIGHIGVEDTHPHRSRRGRGDGSAGAGAGGGR